MITYDAPARFENMLSQVETLQIAAISIMSIVACQLVVLIHALYRAGATIREFMAIFKPGRRLVVRMERRVSGSEEKRAGEK
jgi:hypothetical protein